MKDGRQRAPKAKMGSVAAAAGQPCSAAVIAEDDEGGAVPAARFVEAVGDGEESRR
jgi:hypothetical protein